MNAKILISVLLSFVITLGAMERPVLKPTAKPAPAKQPPLLKPTAKPVAASFEMAEFHRFKQMISSEAKLKEFVPNELQLSKLRGLPLKAWEEPNDWKSLPAKEKKLIQSILDISYPDTMQAIMDGANVNIQTGETKRTPLMFALATQASASIVDALLRAGADPKIKDIFGLDASDYANMYAVISLYKYKTFVDLLGKPKR